MTNTEAADKIVAHHRSMVATLNRHLGAVTDAVRDGRDVQEAAQLLSGYLSEEVFPHAQAEEVTLYAAAAKMPELKPLIESMLAEHVRLRNGLEMLSNARDGLEIYGAARVVTALFEAHADKENESVLPFLVRDRTVSLDGLLAGLREHLVAPDQQEDSASDVDLDVRQLPHAQRHTTIFGLLQHLAPRQALVITVDHDPQPLRHRLEAVHADEFGWEYLEKGPAVWRIAIRRRDSR